MPSTRWKSAIVVGASSGIGEALARQLVHEGVRTALVSRREPELKALAASLNEGEGKSLAIIYPHDVTNTNEAPALFDRIARDLDGVDLVIYCAGVMPAIGPDEYNIDKDAAIFDVNVKGAMSWLNLAAQRFGQQRGGTIVGISSVAGDRGRRGQPAYCASKAALNTYMESLRNRLSTRGVTVVTIKPGPVDTPLTAGLGKLPLMVDATTAASEILAAARNGANTAYVPSKWRPIMAILRGIPSSIFRYLKV